MMKKLVKEIGAHVFVFKQIDKTISLFNESVGGDPAFQFSGENAADIKVSALRRAFDSMLE